MFCFDFVPKPAIAPNLGLITLRDHPHMEMTRTISLLEMYMLGGQFNLRQQSLLRFPNIDSGLDHVLILKGDADTTPSDARSSTSKRYMNPIRGNKLSHSGRTTKLESQILHLKQKLLKMQHIKTRLVRISNTFSNAYEKLSTKNILMRRNPRKKNPSLH